MKLKEKTSIIKRINKLGYMQNAIGKKLVEDIDFNLLKWFILRKQPVNYYRAGITFLERGVPVICTNHYPDPGTLKKRYIVIPINGDPVPMVMDEDHSVRAVDPSTCLGLLGERSLFMPCTTNGMQFEDHVKEISTSLKERLDSYEFRLEHKDLYYGLLQILKELEGSSYIVTLHNHLKKGGSVKRLKNGLTLKFANNHYSLPSLVKLNSEENYEIYQLTCEDLFAEDWIALDIEKEVE